MSGRYYLLEDPATGKTIRTFIEDQSFTLPRTQATAYVDAGYTDNIAPYFADPTTAMDWIDGVGVTGRLVVTSDYASIELRGNINLWIAPGVSIDAVTVANINTPTRIEGKGTITTLEVDGSPFTYIAVDTITTMTLTGTAELSVTSRTASKVTVTNCLKTILHITENMGDTTITDESVVTIIGSPTITQLDITYNSNVFLRDGLISGYTYIDSTSRLTALHSEFISLLGAETITCDGMLTLQGCWVYSLQSHCIYMNKNQSNTAGSLILDDTKLYCEDTRNYSVIANSATPLLDVRVYGGSVARTAMQYCSSVTTTLVVDQAMEYKYY